MTMPVAHRQPGVVLVTGGASGLGRAVAEALDKAGETPVVLDKDKPARSDLDHEQVDLTDPRAAEAAVARAAERHDGLDAVVTAAALDSCGSLTEVPAEEWERVIAVNLVGTAAVVRAALPSVQANRGRVVTIGSTLGFRPMPDATAYSASKFGVVGFSRALAAETAETGVGVTMVSPGGMRTSFFDGRPEQYKPGPDQQLNNPEDVAETVMFALRQPTGCEVRELLVAPAEEPSWP